MALESTKWVGSAESATKIASRPTWLNNVEVLRSSSLEAATEQSTWARFYRSGGAY